MQGADTNANKRDEVASDLTSTAAYRLECAAQNWQMSGPSAPDVSQRRGPGQNCKMEKERGKGTRWAQGGTAVPAGVLGLNGRSAETGARDSKVHGRRDQIENEKEVGLREKGGEREREAERAGQPGRRVASRNGPAKT